MTISAQRVQVGGELRRARERLGLSGVQVANELSWSQSKVSRIEAGRLSVSLNDLAALLRLYELPEEVRAELLSIAVASDGLQGSWVVRAGGPSRRQGEVAAIESRVRQIRQYGAMTVPGLLQVESYTRAIADANGLGDAEAVVRRRKERQAILDTGRLDYYVVIDERALLRWPGDPTVMRQQCAWLVELIDKGSVQAQVLPLGATTGSVGTSQFVVYDFCDVRTPSVVLLEAQGSDTYLSAVEDLSTYGALFDNLWTQTLPPAASIGRLRALHLATPDSMRSGDDHG